MQCSDPASRLAGNLNIHAEDESAMTDKQTGASQLICGSTRDGLFCEAVILEEMNFCSVCREEVDKSRFHSVDNPCAKCGISVGEDTTVCHSCSQNQATSLLEDDDSKDAEETAEDDRHTLLQCISEDLVTYVDGEDLPLPNRSDKEVPGKCCRPKVLPSHSDKQGIENKDEDNDEEEVSEGENEEVESEFHSATETDDDQSGTGQEVCSKEDNQANGAASTAKYPGKYKRKQKKKHHRKKNKKRKNQGTEKKKKIPNASEASESGNDKNKKNEKNTSNKNISNHNNDLENTKDSNATKDKQMNSQEKRNENIGSTSANKSSGAGSQSGRKVRVYFHGIVSDEFDFRIGGHKLILRMSDNWENFSRVCTVNSVQNGVKEFKYCMDLEASDRKLWYKYCIMKPSGKYVWEYYADSYEMVCDRALLKNWLHSEEWHQYDGVLRKKRGFLFEMAANIFLSESLDHARFCAQHFGNKIIEEENTLPSFENVLEKLMMLFLSLRKVYYIDAKIWQDRTNEFHFVSEIGRIILSPFFDVLGMPDRGGEQEWSDTHREVKVRAAISIVLLCYEIRYLHLLSLGIWGTVCPILRMRPNFHTKTCHELSVVNKYFPKKREKVCDAFQSLACAIAQTGFDPSWLYLMPWIHFLSGWCKPFEYPSLSQKHDDKEPLWWGLNYKLNEAAACFMRNSQGMSGALKGISEQLRPIYEVDYLMPRTLVASISLQDILHIVDTEMIPAEVFLANAIYYIQRRVDEGVLRNYMGTITSCVQTNRREYSAEQMQIQLLICKQLVDVSLERRVVTLVVCATRTYIHCVSKYEATCRRSETNSNTQFDSSPLQKMAEKICGWISSNSRDPGHLQLWNSFFVDDANMLEDIREKWNSYITNALRESLSMLYEEHKTLGMDLMQLSLETFDQYCACMKDCLTNWVFKIICEGVEVSHDHIRGEARNKIKSLLSDLFYKEWEEHMNMIENDAFQMIHHFLDWSNCMLYLKTYKMGHFFSNENAVHVTKVVSVIEDIEKALLSGEITLDQLKHIQGTRHNFQDVMAFATDKDADYIKQVIDFRQQQVDEFNLLTDQVKLLMALCKDLKNVDSSPVQEVLGQSHDLSNKQICEICRPGYMTGDVTCQSEVIAYDLSEEVLNMLPELFLYNDSSVFQKLWSKQCKAKSSACFTYDELEEKVWRPVKQELETLSKKLKVGSIKFGELERLINGQTEDIDDIKVELEALAIQSDIIRERVEQLSQYRQLHFCVEGAKTILQFAHHYNLSKDFDVIEKIAKHSQGDTEMRRFDPNILETCKILQHITREKEECLATFLRCRPFIDWLKDTIKEGLKELKVFVELAFNSVGDDLDQQQQLQCFYTAVTGYAPLIFDLDESCDYQQLLQFCNVVWKELETNSKLPEQLDETNTKLEWLKDIQKSLGSVEMTSFMQADAINSSGVYEVGHCVLDSLDRQTGGFDIKDVVKLTVSTGGREDQIRIYTFTQLQDLQSRLMLIAGEHSSDQDKNSLERFIMIFDGITRLAKVYLRLLSSGCVLFEDFSITVYCHRTRKVCANLQFSQKENVDSLQGKLAEGEDVKDLIPKIAGFLEQCLNDWLNHIKEKRQENVYLNFFTIDQLVILQKGVVALGTSDEKSCWVYPLLSAVKENCTQDDLEKAMRDAKDEIIQKEIENDDDIDDEYTDDVTETEGPVDDIIQTFITEMVEAGYDEDLAKLASQHVDPNNIEDGVMWCMEYLLENNQDESDTEDMDETAETVRKQEFTRWCDSQTDLHSLMSSNLQELTRNRDSTRAPLLTKLQEVWTNFLQSMTSSVNDYINLEHLGIILKHLAAQDTRLLEREFLPLLKVGQPNLIICPNDDVLVTTLSIYLTATDQPLPQADEVLLCTSKTTKDEVEIFLRRAVFSDHGKIHSLLNAECLNYDVSEFAERCLEQYIQETNHEDVPYQLVVICASENEYRSTFISSLDKYKVQPLRSNFHTIQDRLCKQLTVADQILTSVRPATAVDPDHYSVRLIKSNRAGVGKTLYKQRCEEKLSLLNRFRRVQSISIPLQESNVDNNYVAERLFDIMQGPGEVTPRLIHIDISHGVLHGVDNLLFNLVILGCLTDEYGHVWRKSSNDLFLIETWPLTDSSRQVGDTQHIVHRMLSILPETVCKSPTECLNVYEYTRRKRQRNKGNEHHQLFDEELFGSEVYQRPFQYLYYLDNGIPLDQIDKRHPLHPRTNPEECLKVLIRHCGLEDPSWSELHHFVWFLNTQLADLERNVYTGLAAADFLPGFAKFVLLFLIQMSKDFATHSLNMSEESPGQQRTAASTSAAACFNEEVHDDTDDEDFDELRPFQIRRRWESSPHPYLFFNSDRHTFTFLGFYIDKRTGNLIDSQSNTVLVKKIIEKTLSKALYDNKVPLTENFDVLSRQDKILKLCNVMGIDMPHDPDNTYELTTDNVKKMLAIYMRFRCDIPVIIMGETGCGKTCLIKFMCALQVPPGAEVQNMVLMKVHGGTTKSDIERKVREADALARENSDSDFKNMYTVLFFDEANTTESIGLIKEIMCDKSMAGKKLDLCDSLKIVAACNPYRKHSEELIKKLEQAGLGYHVDADETTDRLGRVPMRRLVYRVQPLPHSLLPLVWDFGQLNTQVEELYIRQMVRRYAHQGDLPSTPGLVEAVSAILAASQKFLRMCNDECSFVSLRDVERALTVMSWFYKQSHDERTLFGLMDQMLDKVDESSEEEEEDSSDDELSFTLASEDARVDDVTRSLILALGVCYHACLKSRELYRCFISKSFTAPVSLPGGEDQILTEIECCQDVFLESVTLDKNIARNMALKENIFMMVVCIELRIPLFLVGKPGSSKSLAKTIVSDAMQGRRSKCYLFKELKAAHMVSFQCSPLSTADGIVSTFKQCAQFQQDKDLDNYVAVVVLDEVGLAEDSPRMPLKALHPLLEDGCLGNETPKPHEKVAFIGISNWALDPAKMNRGILVQREVPDLEELVKSARGICEMDGNDRSVKSRILAKKMKILLEPLATAYLELFDTASNQMREFFGLRDFYSLMKMVCGFVLKSRRRPTWYEILHAVKRNFGGMEHVDSEACFRKHLQTVIPIYDKRRKGDPECTPDGLITACLFDTNNLASQSRYLLLLTENYGAISIMEQLIHTKSRDFRPVTIFGSSFRSDQEYTQVCRNINKIKVCMETGNTVVLLNLENLYESLYDALNQYYEYCRGERYVNLGLGTHQVKCSVHANFRLIVVAEKETVYKKFPIPLINRLEKHFLTISTLLNADQLKIVDQIKSWVEQFCSRENLPRTHSERNVRDGTSRLSGVFIGFNEDACSAIVLNVWDKHAGVPERNNQVFRDSKLVLLWCATPDSVVSLKFSQLPMEEQVFLQDSYFRDQAHGSLTEYLHQKIVADGRNTALFAQITTHSKLLASADRKEISSATNIPIDDILFLESLPSFDTEQQFSIRVRQYLHRAKRDDQHLIIIQCESGDINADLVACARYCVMDEIEKMRDELSACVHVVLIIQLPRHSVFTGFQCGIWQSAHIDDLRPEETGMPHVSQMLQMSPAQLVSGFVIKGDSEEETELSSGILISSIHAALGLVKEEEENTNRETERVTIVMELLQQNQTDGTSYFVHGLICLLARLLSEKESVSYSFQLAREWVVKEAATDESLSKTGTFRRSCIQTLQKKVIPIIAGIIAFLDTNDNLKLLLDNNTSWKSRLWKGLLSNHEALSLKYSDLQTHNNKSELPEVTVKTTGYENHRYSARVPFSWIIIEEIEEILAVLKQTNTYENDTGEEDGRSDQDVAIEILCRNFIGRFLNCHEFVDSVEEIVHEYVHDLIHTFYHTATQDELQLVSESILYRASKLVGPEKTLVNQLVCIHKAHIILSEEMQYFRDINRIWPECSAAIINAREEQPDHFMFCEKAYTFSGLCLMVESLAPASKELNDATGRAHWLNRVHRFRPTVENILCWHKKNPSLYGARSLQCVRKATFLWNRVLVMKLFLEHVCMSDQEDKISIKYIITLWKYLGEEADLKQMKTLKGLETFLKACNKQAETQYKGAEIECAHCGRKLDGVPVTLPCKDIICEQCLDLMSSMQNRCMKCNKQFDDNWSPLKNSSPRLAERMLKDYQKRCNTFFMDVVSQLCFADSEAPSQDVVEHLLGYIFLTSRDKQQKSCTRTMSVIETGIDPNPVFRSFLLQLLLKTSEDHVSGYIQSYLDLARQCVVDDDKDNIAQTLELNLLVIQCIENKLIQDCCKGESTSEASCAVQALRAASSGIQSDQQDVEKLYAIARTRMGLSIAAKYIAQIVKQQIDVKLADYGVRRVIDAAWKLYDESKLEWIRKYLVKYICRRYGTDIYSQACRSAAPSLRWLALTKEEEEKATEVPDRFIVCGRSYTNVREVVTQIVLGENVSHLTEVVEGHSGENVNTALMLGLAQYREITCSNLCPEHQRNVTPQVVKKIQEFIGSCDLKKHKELLDCIMLNQLTPHRLVVTEGEDEHLQGVQCLLVHFMLVMNTVDGRQTLLEALQTLIQNPGTCTEMLLPTMPQDDIVTVKEALLNSRQNASEENPVFYHCPNGHPYFIGDCGRPYVVDKCNECGADIGGRGHKLLHDNIKDDGVDRTVSGHILGPAETRGQGPDPMRMMRPLYCATVRLMLHLAMYLGAGAHPEDIGTVIKSNIADTDVEEFVWDHLQLDLEDMQRALGRSTDDVLLLMHIILHQISAAQHLGDRLSDEACYLTTKEGRETWETRLCSMFLEPVFKKLDELLKRHNLLLAEDERLGTNTMLCMLYETANDGSDNMSAHHQLQEMSRVWRYSTPITWQHLKQQLDAMFTSQNGAQQHQYRVLQIFVEEEPILKALRFVPSILKLHQILLHKYQRKIDRKEASQITVADIMRDLDGSEMDMLLKHFTEAWEIVRGHLKTRVCPTRAGGAVVPVAYSTQRITPATPISVLLPSIRDAGLCSYAMLDFLFRKHNQVLDRYCKETDRSASVMTVSPREVTAAHLISYDPEHDILPLILANCQYSFEMGKGTKIEYDFTGLERQLMDRFLFSKSRIEVGNFLQVDEMVYRTELTDAEIFQKLEEKIPQESLDPTVKVHIYDELRTLPDICGALDNIDIVISFLKSTGGQPEENLHNFMVNVLKMNQGCNLSLTVRRHCELRHCKALWLYLSLLKARQMMNQKQSSEAVFETVPPQLHEELPEDLVLELKEYMTTLSTEHLSRLVEDLFEFIVLKVAVRDNRNDADLGETIDFKLGEFLSEYITLMDRPEVLVRILETFPADITYRYCVHSWINAHAALNDRKPVINNLGS